MNKSKLTPKVQKNLTLALAILWLVCAVVWGVLIVVGLQKDAAILQTALHVFCAVLAAMLAVINFFRWRKMPDGGSSAEDTLDSADK